MKSKKVVIRLDQGGTTKYYIDVIDRVQYLKTIVRDFEPWANLMYARKINLVDTI